MKRLARDYGAVGLGVAIFTGVYIALDFNKLYALRYGADLGTFLQLAVNLRHGSSFEWGEWRPHFQVHDSWLLWLLALPVATVPKAQTLLVIQVLAVACAAFVLVRFARALGNAAIHSQILGLAYLLAPATQGLAYDNFTESVFVPLGAFLAALAVYYRAFWWSLLAAQCLLGLKEDEAVFLLWFGIACAIWWDRRIGVSIAALAAANGLTFLVFERLVHAHPSLPSYAFAVHNVSGKISMTLLLLAPYAFAPLAAGRRFLLTAPLFAEIVFAQPWAFELSRIGSHWVAPLLAGVSLAAALGLRRWPNCARFMLPCAFIAGVIFSDTVLKPGRWPYIVDWNRYTAAVRLRDTMQPATVPREDEGVWAVAAANPFVRLGRTKPVPAQLCPAYNTDAAQFFASIGLWRAPHERLCGGVPIGPSQPSDVRSSASVRRAGSWRSMRAARASERPRSDARRFALSASSRSASAHAFTSNAGTSIAAPSQASGNAEASLATTGAPHAIASTAMRPYPSALEGTATASAPL
jgi:uncharacterized membrane protein